MKWFSSVYSILAVSTFFLFIAVGIGGVLQSHSNLMSSSTMRQLTKGMPISMIEDVIVMELPQLHQHRTRSKMSEEQIIVSLFRQLTDIDPYQPWSIVSSELPGRTYITAYPTSEDDHHDHTSGVNEPTQIAGDDGTPVNTESEMMPTDGGEETTDDEPHDIGQIEDEHTELSPTPIKQIKAFIYHSHNRESWLPELEGITRPNEAFDQHINVTLLGDRLAERLEEHGIGAVSSNTDYASTVEEYNWNFSYAYSLDTVQEAFAEHPELEYFLDLHRDSQPSDITTVTIDGLSYAKVYFVIGRKNPDWEKNEALAAKIHEKMEASYPGISRGILGKTSNSGHAEYNQSFSANSILIEIGGVENTLEQSYRTIDVLGDVIAEIFWEAEQVDSSERSH